MKKKIFLMLTMVALLVCAFAISVSAAEKVDGIYYTFSGTEATVASDNQKSCELETVVIPEKVTFGGTEYTVTAIAGKAFGSQNSNGGNSYIKSLTVPSTVTSVGEWAFANCPNITEVYCKSQKIGNRMFQDCAALDTLTLENTVEIGSNAFNRTVITSVVIPSTVTTVGEYAFKQCKSLTKVVILGSIMGKYMFYECSALNTLVLTESFATFGTSCLGNATSNAFVTYYTGDDYERIKELGSSTSRFSKAGCYSYSDYVASDYTDTYMLIYDTNLCVAAFDGIHTEPADDGDCTTALTCSVCSDYICKSAKEHTEILTYTYANGYTEGGKRTVGCTNDGCNHVKEQEDILPLFITKGYSKDMSSNAIVFNIVANNEAISEYEEYLVGVDSETSIDYGVVVALADEDDNIENDVLFDENAKLKAGVIAINFVEKSYTCIQTKITGIGEGNYDTLLHCNGYINVNGVITYINGETTDSYAEKISYGTLPNE